MTTLLRLLGMIFLLSSVFPLRAMETDPEHLVWPFGSAQPRVAFVGSFTRPADLGIGKTLLETFKEFLFGASETHLRRPMAVVTSNGVIFVADPGAKGVHRFDRSAGQYALITAADNAPLPSPVGLARGASGEIYVADSKLALIFVIQPGAREATPLRLNTKLTQPTGIAHDPANNRLYVADTAEHQVRVFDGDGSLFASIGQRGSGDGEFNFPTYLWLTDQGQLYVTDSLNFRIQRLDQSGQFVGRLSRQGDGTGDAARPKGVATDHYGHVYVVDALFHAFQIFDATGRLLLPIGERGQGPGEFWLPNGIFIDDDTIYIADSYNQRIQMFRYIGGAT